MPSATSPPSSSKNCAYGTNIDATSRLVEQQDPRAPFQDAGEHNLLLVPTRQRSDRGLGARSADPQALHRPVRAAKLLTTPGDARGAPGAEGDVRPDRSAEGQTLTVAVLGHERHAGVERHPHGADRQGLSVDLDPSADRRAGAGDRLEQLAAPASHQAGEADDLPAANFEV